MHIGEQPPGKLVGGAVKDHQFYQHLLLHQEFVDGRCGDAHSLVPGKVVHAGGDQRERHALATKLMGQMQALLVAGAQGRFLTVSAALPNRAYRVDDILGLQLERRGNRRLPDGNISQLTALCQQGLGPGGLVDGAVRPAADAGVGIGRVDDGIGGHFGDVVSDDAERHGRSSFPL